MTAPFCPESLRNDILRQIDSILGAGTRGLEGLRAKDGVYVLRALHNGKPLIVKYLAGEPSRREIVNYRLLMTLGVQTLAVLGASDRCLCLEDLAHSVRLRLGTEQDLDDPVVARALAGWYRDLHDRGAGLPELSTLYSEYDILTPENLRILGERVPGAASTWEYVEKHRDALFAPLETLGVTLTYNDFYWTNLAVGRDRRSALMFDYNLMGRGYRYGDIRNVCSALSPQAGDAFVEAYGAFDPREVLVDDCLSHIVNLISACTHPQFPPWASESLRIALDGTLITRARHLARGV
ncbi:MAG: hypothetical protein ACYCYF_09825 [Anaerolineae bacterium]